MASSCGSFCEKRQIAQSSVRARSAANSLPVTSSMDTVAIFGRSENRYDQVLSSTRVEA